MPASPSLLIVPARFKTGKLYTQIATTSAGVVLGSSGDFNVTRATTATRFNSAGLIESVASGVPRLDYYTSGGTAGCPALLVEPSAQNSALQSEDFTTTWAATNIVVSGNTTGTLDPYGTNLADLLTATASGSSRVVQTFNFVSGTTYTYSCFAKAGNGFFGMTMENGGVASGVAVIWNVSTGAFSVSGSVGSGYTLQAHNIENYGNGWYRCSMRVLLGSTVTGNIRVNTSNGTMSSVVVQSDNGNSVNVFGAQVETGSVATSYIPTTTGSVTRNADVINLSGAVSGCIGQTEGTIYAEFEYKTNIAERRLIALSDNTTTNRVFAWTLNNILYVQVQGTSVIVANPISAGYHKVAFAYQQSGVSGTLFASLDGGAVVSGTTAGTFPSSLTAINVGKNETTGTSSFFWNANIRSAAIYTSRLTNAELIALSTL